MPLSPQGGPAGNALPSPDLTHLQAKVQLPQRAPDLPGECVHPLTLLQGDHDVGGALLRPSHQLWDVKLVCHPLQYFFQKGLDLSAQEAEG